MCCPPSYSMKNVPSSHFILHEAHCLRFLAPQRKEPVLGAKTQEHCEQRDSQVSQWQGTRDLRTRGFPVLRQLGTHMVPWGQIIGSPLLQT